MPTIALPYQVSIDASFRHRNGRAQGASVIQSVELMERNACDRKTVVHDMISICRRKGTDFPLAVVCAFARDRKSCYMHGTEEEWQKKIAAGGRERDDALSLNCFSGSAISFPLAAQLAEGVGAKIICLRTLLEGFMVTRVSHDQDSHIGNIYRAFFNANECYDRAHIQVGAGLMYTVSALVRCYQIIFFFAVIISFCSVAQLYADTPPSRFVLLFAHFPLVTFMAEKSEEERREMRERER